MVQASSVEEIDGTEMVASMKADVEAMLDKKVSAVEVRKKKAS